MSDARKNGFVCPSCGTRLSQPGLKNQTLSRHLDVVRDPAVAARLGIQPGDSCPYGATGERD